MSLVSDPLNLNLTDIEIDDGAMVNIKKHLKKNRSILKRILTKLKGLFT